MNEVFVQLAERGYKGFTSTQKSNYPRIIMDLFKEHTELLVAAGAECKPFDLATITEKDVLVLIDCQNDFFPADFVEDGGRFGVSVESEQMEVIV